MIDLVALLYNRALQDYNNHHRNSGTVWVSALTQCPLKWRYAIQYPELATAQFFSGSFEIGKLVHQGIQSILSETFDQVRIEVELEKVVDGITVKGRADAIVADTVIEIKYARSDRNIPHSHHVDQLKIYMNLASKPFGVLFYVTPERVVQYNFADPLPDSILLDMVRKFRAGSPAPRFPWECQYCPFRRICPAAR